MKKRVALYLYLILFSSVSLSNPFVLAGEMVFKFAPFLVAAVTTGGGLIWQHLRDGKRKRRKARLREDAYWHRVNEANGWSIEQFKARLERIRGLNEWGEIPADFLFEQYDYYQFPNFQTLLREHPFFDSSICDLKKKIKNGATIDFCDKREQEKFKKIVDQLAFEADRARAIREHEAQQARERQEKQASYQKRIRPILDQQKNGLYQLQLEYENALEAVQLHSEHAQSFVVKRYQALAVFTQGNQVWLETQYSLCTETRQLLHEHEITTIVYDNFYGTQLQQVVHQEFIEILNTTATVRYQDTADAGNKGLTTTLTLFADAGQQHNHAGYVKEAFSCADFCWGMLECIQGISQFLDECSMAISRGTEKGVKNFGYKMMHLDQTLMQAASSLCRFVSGWLKGIQECNQRFEKELLDLLEKRITPSQLWERDKKRFKEKCCKMEASAYAAVTYIWENLEREKVLLAAERGSELITDMALTHVTFSAVGSLFSNASAGMAQMLRKGDTLKHLGDIPVSGDGLASYVALGSLSIAEEAAIATEAVGAVAVATMDAASIVAPPAFLVVDTPVDVVEEAMAIEAAPMPPDPDDIEKIERMIELQKKFRVRIEGPIDRVHPVVAKAASNKIHHLLASRHQWYKLVHNPEDWDAIARIISKVLYEGRVKHEIGEVFIKSLYIGGEIVEVRYIGDVNIIKNISTAWVKR